MDTPKPADSIIPDALHADPFVRQLRTDNSRLRARVAVLEARLERMDATFRQLAAIVAEAGATKTGAHG